MTTVFFTAAAISSSSFSVAAVCCFFTLLPASPSLPTLPCSVLLLLVVVVIQSYLDSSTFSVTTYFYARQFDKISGRRRDQNNEEIATTKRVKTKQIKNQTRIGTLSDSDSEPNTYVCMHVFIRETDRRYAKMRIQTILLLNAQRCFGCSFLPPHSGRCVSVCVSARCEYRVGFQCVDRFQCINAFVIVNQYTCKSN